MISESMSMKTNSCMWIVLIVIDITEQSKLLLPSAMFHCTWCSTVCLAVYVVVLCYICVCVCVWGNQSSTHLLFSDGGGVSSGGTQFHSYVKTLSFWRRQRPRYLHHHRFGISNTKQLCEHKAQNAMPKKYIWCLNILSRTCILLFTFTVDSL